jgi:hypothetical protein
MAEKLEPGWYWVRWREDGDWWPERIEAGGYNLAPGGLSSDPRFHRYPVSLGPRIEPPGGD